MILLLKEKKSANFVVALEKRLRVHIQIDVLCIKAQEYSLRNDFTWEFTFHRLTVKLCYSVTRFCKKEPFGLEWWDRMLMLLI